MGNETRQKGDKIMRFSLRSIGSFTVAVLALLLPALDSAAQTELVPSVVHYQHVIRSQVLGEDRTILVRLPQGYERSTDKYPAAYMLDAHSPQNAMMAGIVEQQVWGGVIPDMIVVGLQNTNRLRDMTPTATDRAGSGGAQKFLQFIETEVIPFIDKNYRTESYRIIAGHSLAGLFVVHSFVERPALFNAFIAASPVLHWDNDHVIKQAAAVLKQDKEWKRHMFIGIGDEPDYIGGFTRFRELMKRSKARGLDYEFKEFKDENHSSVVLPAYYAGLRMVFDGWRLKQAGSVSDVESHYRKLSGRFGYLIQPPENMLNQLGYLFLAAERLDEAVSAFQKNVGYYPHSANVYDSLGEAYERSGRLKLARDNYEKAYSLADKNTQPEFVRIVKANFDRVSAKLK